MEKNAVVLSSDPAEADRRLWYFLRRKRLGGFKFRRRQPVGPYMAEFACDEGRLVVEIDGGRCATGTDADELRDASLAVHEYRVLRFESGEVLRQIATVLAAIHAALVAIAGKTNPGAHSGARGERRPPKRRRARTRGAAPRPIPDTTG